MTLDTSNIFDRFRGMQTTNCSGGGSTTNFSPETKPIPNDNYSFTNGMGENLSYCKEKSIAGPVLEGTLNDKNTVLKVISDKKDTYYQGIIGNKDVMLMQKNRNITGTYGGKNVNITFDCNKPSSIGKFFNCTLRGKVFKPDYFNINGTIDGKPISIKLPNAEIPQDEDTKDMISLALLECGLEAETFGNRIVGLGYSKCQKTHIMGIKQEREKKIDENVKPLITQSISMIVSVALGAILGKVGINKP